MTRVTITLANSIHDKLKKYADENEFSFSQTIAKMAELGLMVSERRNDNANPEEKFADIERHCFKLIIQMNALLKNLVKKELNYGQEELAKLTELALNRYNELMHVYPDGL